MDFGGFSIFDIAVLATIFLGALFGLVTGFVRGGLFVASWIGAGLITIFGLARVSPLAARYINPEWLADLVAGAALFIVALIVLHLLSHILSGWVRAGRLNALDRSLGLLAGLATAGIVISVAFLFLSDVFGDEPPPWVENARTRPAVERGALLVKELLPAKVIGETGDALKRAQQRANDIDAARDALDRLTRPPESSAPRPQEGYNERERDGLEDLIRRNQ
ncbi:MAG: CvpA family protein [Alphaproteobacteria bacterium]